MSNDLRKMSDHEFISYCYKKLLRRLPDKESLGFYLDLFTSKGITKEEFLQTLMSCDEFEEKLASQEFVSPGHFYSAVPSIEERLAFCDNEEIECRSLDGISLNVEKQIDLLFEFSKHCNECPFPDKRTDEFRYHFINEAYSYSDALILYSMIRHYRPKRIIEIGSGFSSCVMLDTNQLYFNGEIDIKFIEPYPDRLLKLIKDADRKCLFADNKLQNVDVRIFENLEENDILFIDSTHVTKLNSDVNKIIFKILPLLKKGVIVHFHDIFWPFEYPKHWIREGRAWNEAYILHAFLKYNNNYEIMFFYDYLHKYHNEIIKEKLPLCLKGPGCNLWIKKV